MDIRHNNKKETQQQHSWSVSTGPLERGAHIPSLHVACLEDRLEQSDLSRIGKSTKEQKTKTQASGFLPSRSANQARADQRLLLRAGDVETNPGPKWPCPACNKSAKFSSIMCHDCGAWWHIRCANLNTKKAQQAIKWTCKTCPTPKTDLPTESTEQGTNEQAPDEAEDQGTLDQCDLRVTDTKKDVCDVCKRYLRKNHTMQCLNCNRCMHKQCTKLSRTQIEQHMDHKVEMCGNCKTKGKRCRKCGRDIRHNYRFARCKICEETYHFACANIGRQQRESDRTEE